MSEASEQFAQHIEGVARLLLGEPNTKLSRKNELRWGSNGALSVKPSEGKFYDQADKTGGGCLDLIVRVAKLSGRKEAVAWLKERGFSVPDDGRPRSKTNGNGHANGHANGAAAEAQLDQAPPWEEEAGEDTAASPNGNYTPPGVPAEADLVKSFDYIDEGGQLLFQVCRFEWQVKDRAKPEKTFRQRRPDGKGGWYWSVRDVRQVPYRLPELIEAISSDVIVFIAEGEKAVDAIAELGVPATCNAGGAGKWPESLTPLFAGARVVILPDNDDPGRKHRNLVAKQLDGVAASVSILDLPDLPHKGDVVDWVAAGGTVDALYALVETKAQPWSEEIGFESRFKAVRWRDLDLPAPEHEFLIKGLLTRGERSMLAGPSQSGKSFLAIDLALSVARGIPFFGRRTLHGAVVYQAGEGGRGIRKRLRAYRQRNGLSLEDDLPFVLLPAPVDLYASDDQTNALIEEILFWKRRFTVPLELAVIDTLSAATPGANENASDDMSRVLARCARIADVTSAHVMLVHHMNADGNKPRGHTSVVANLDSVIVVRKVDNAHDMNKRLIREARLTKQKDGEDDAVFRFVLASVVLGTDAEGDDITSCVVAPPEEGALAGVDFTSDKGIRLTPQCEVLLRAIYHAVDEYGEAPPAQIRLPAGTRIVDWRWVFDVFARTTLEGDTEGEDETRRHERVKKALQRHGTTLLSKQIIGREKPYIWLTGKKTMGFAQPRRHSQVLDPPLPAAGAAQPDDDFLPF